MNQNTAAYVFRTEGDKKGSRGGRLCGLALPFPEVAHISPPAQQRGKLFLKLRTKRRDGLKVYSALVGELANLESHWLSPRFSNTKLNPIPKYKIKGYRQFWLTALDQAMLACRFDTIVELARQTPTAIDKGEES